jgi:hypothetical protein
MKYIGPIEDHIHYLVEKCGDENVSFILTVNFDNFFNLRTRSKSTITITNCLSLKNVTLQKWSIPSSVSTANWFRTAVSRAKSVHGTSFMRYARPFQMIDKIIKRNHFNIGIMRRS